MGKVRKQKQKAPRVDPVGLDSAIAELQHGMDQVSNHDFTIIDQELPLKKYTHLKLKF